MLHISYCVFHVSVFYFYGLNIFCLNNVSENATKNEAMSPFVARYNPFRIWRKDFPCIRNSEIRRKILLWDVWQHGPNWATQIWIDSHWLTNPSPLFVVGSRFPTWRREGIEFPIWYDLVACTCFPASLCMLITSWHVIHREFTTKKDPRPAGAHLFVPVLGSSITVWLFGAQTLLASSFSQICDARFLLGLVPIRMTLRTLFGLPCRIRGERTETSMKCFNTRLLKHRTTSVIFVR